MLGSTQTHAGTILCEAREHDNPTYLYKSTHSQHQHQTDLYVQLHALSTLSPVKAPHTHQRGEWVGPSASMDAVGKKNHLLLP
jgi:hypothetical protein